MLTGAGAGGREADVSTGIGSHTGFRVRSHMKSKVCCGSLVDMRSTRDQITEGPPNRDGHAAPMFEADTRAPALPRAVGGTRREGGSVDRLA